jgi:glucose 1-dehydrogenase
MRLMNRQALVTGADSGIGQAIAREFAREGANVVVHYHEDRAGAEQTAAEVRSFGRRAAVIRHDLANPDSARSLFDEAVLAFGTIDLLVNCAGISPGVGKSVDMTLDEFHRIIHVNLVSPWVLCQAAARHMGDARRKDPTGGVILNITSVHEVIPSWGGAAYDAAKAGLRNITRNLARELASSGIRVNNIAPGFIATPMTQEALDDPAEMEKSLAHIPLARVGRPEEVAQVAVFLASEDAAYVTGSSYFVDGGLMLMTGAGA